MNNCFIVVNEMSFIGMFVIEIIINNDKDYINYFVDNSI